MQKEYRIVHGGCHLQNIRDIVRNIGDPSKNDIRSFVDRNRSSDHRQEQHRLKVRGCRKEQDQKYQHHNDRHDHGHLGFYMFLRKFICGGHADQIALFPADLLDRRDCPVRPLAGIALHKGDIHDCVAVFIIIVNVVIADK